MQRKTWCAALFAGAMFTLLGAASVNAAPALTFTTLGTNSGPIPNAHRAEAAGLVRYGDVAMLADVGDGAAWQLAKAGVDLGQINAILISHLHFDHTGGLFAFLGQRYQSRYNGPLVIYGPPGTKQTFDGLLTAMKVGIEVSGTIRGPADALDNQITVVELTDGASFAVGSVIVTAAVNSHYSNMPAGSPEAARNLSLSYRFDAPGRSVLYTGDTGPSVKVEQLCKGADLLVSEIMDPVQALNRLKKVRPDIPPAGYPVIEAHFRKEHLAPDEVGLLAERCGAKALVLTHDAVLPEGVGAARAAIAVHYKGPITFAEDGQTF